MLTNSSWNQSMKQLTWVHSNFFQNVTDSENIYINGGKQKMNNEVKELQLNDLNVKILMNEEKATVPASKKDSRFAELLEYFWNQDEEAEALPVED